jgi:hypothetical protein
MAETDRSRAHTMAVGAWRRFGHSSEPEADLAQRIADIGAAQGLTAAAQAIADDCNAHGLQMSAQRVLKGLADDLQHPQAPGPRPMPPGVQRLVEGKSSRGGCIGMIALLLVLSAAAGHVLLS